MLLALLRYWLTVFVISTRFFTDFLIFQGWDDVSFHGSPQIPTPTLDGLAESGVILNNYYVSPMDSPTRAAFMTGKYALNLGNQFIFIKYTLLNMHNL